MVSDVNIGLNGGGEQGQTAGAAADDFALGRKQPDALAAYAKRVNAEPRNFRRYVVKEQERELYHLDRYIITIDDGEVNIFDVLGGEIPDDADILPTPEEEEAIKAQCSAADWPKSATASAEDFEKLKLHKDVGRDAILFKFYDQHDQQRILFVQQRIFRRDACKLDLSWSFWSDGEWRRMEPDYEKLPLFGLDKLKHKNLTTVFVHEGAKTAWFLQQNDAVKAKWWREHAATEAAWSERCPWAKELISYQGRQTAHVGWPGGAPNPHRVNWEPLRQLPPHVQVIVVADNDAAGKNAISKISQALQRHMRVLRFGDDFPRQFDLSDPFPKELYEKNDVGVLVYKRTAPKLDQCLEPATWATVHPKRLRPEFVEEWYYSIKPACFMHQRDLSRRYSKDEFNALVAPFAHLGSNVAALLHKEYSAQGQTIAYAPDRKPGCINYNDMQVINVYRPSNIQPQAGDAGPWLDFMTYLIPTEKPDRRETMHWCATLIACPEIHMLYGLLLISEETGVGKTTLSDILAVLVGHHNCSWPTPDEVTHSQFNGWRAFRRLVAIAEVYAGESSKMANRLKDTITDKNVPYRDLYEATVYIQNWVHTVLSSNSRFAIYLDDKDRRHLVPGITEELRPLAYWQGFYKWLENGGHEVIAHWAQQYVLEHGPVPQGQVAPETTFKRRVIEDGYRDGLRIVLQLGRAFKERETNNVMRLDHIRDWLAEQKADADRRYYGRDGRRFLESHNKIAAVLQKSCGLWVPKKRLQEKTGAPKTRVVANWEISEEVTWKGLEGKWVQPATVDRDSPS